MPGSKFDSLPLRELLETRANLVTESRKVIDTADTEKRGLTTEESQSVDGMLADIETLSDLIGKQNELKRRADKLADFEARLKDTNRNNPDDVRRDNDEQRAPEFIEVELRGHKVRFSPNEGDRSSRAMYERSTPEYQKAFRSYLARGERRGLQVDSDVDGGYTAPAQFVARLIKDIDDETFVRRAANILPVTNADSIGFPSLDTDMDDADWTIELGTGSEDDMKFGKRELHPHPLAKRVKVSKTLLRVSALDIEALIRGRMAYKFGVTAEKAYLTGDGVRKPLGVFVANDAGIPTSRDYSTGNTTTAIVADNLIGAKFYLKGAYLARARWLFHRDVLASIYKLKDGNNQYLWQPGLQAGVPDRLLGLPLDMSEFAPNTMTAGQYVGGLFDWSNYWIADSLSMSVQRLDELYAETNQVGFIGRMETDGMPVRSEAFVRIKLAAS